MGRKAAQRKENRISPLWKTMCKHECIVLNSGSGFHARFFVSILFVFNSDFPFRGVFLFTSLHACLAGSTVRCSGLFLYCS